MKHRMKSTIKLTPMTPKQTTIKYLSKFDWKTLEEVDLIEILNIIQNRKRQNKVEEDSK